LAWESLVVGGCEPEEPPSAASDSLTQGRSVSWVDMGDLLGVAMGSVTITVKLAAPAPQ
jgi:hypothetical protein